MTVAADQRYRSQIWVVAEAFAEAFVEVAADIAADIAAEVLAEVAGGECVGVVDACWRYRRVLAFRARCWRGFQHGRSTR